MRLYLTLPFSYHTVKHSEPMKKETNPNYQTPVKKWGDFNLLHEQGLSIIESEDSADAAQQPELFTALVGATPSFHDRCLTHSPPSESEEASEPSEEQMEEEEESLSSGILSAQSIPHQPASQHPHKQQEPRTTDRLALHPIDQNRKGCNCRNSKCDKNYCDCLRSGQACGEGICSCVDCLNTQSRQERRQTNRRLLEEEATGAKGCRCRKSKCQKKYCECHSAGRKCTPACFCLECNNQPHPDDTHHRYESLRKLRKAEPPTASLFR